MSNPFSEHLRLTILRFLCGAPGYSANNSVLHTVASQFGLSATRDQIKTELAWLGEQNLVSIDELPGLVVATLTERGQDTAEGRCVIPGVQRPSPRR